MGLLVVETSVQLLTARKVSSAFQLDVVQVEAIPLLGQFAPSCDRLVSMC